MNTRRLPPTVVALGLISFFTDVGSEMIFPLLPVFLTTTLGAGPAFLGLVEGAADTVASLLKLVAGEAADRLRRRTPLVVAGYTLASVVRPLVALATAPWQVLVVRVTDRVGKGVRTAPRDALIADAVHDGAAARAFGFHRALDHAGAVVGPLVASALLAAGLDLRQVFWCAALPGALAVAMVLRVREPAHHVAAAPPALGTGLGLPGALSSYLAILLVFSLGNSSDAFLLLRARDLGLPAAALPTLWAVLHVVKFVSAYAGGALADRRPRPRVIVAGWGVYAAVYLGLARARDPWHVWALFALYGVYYGLTEPAEKALVRDLAPAALRGRAYGWYNLIVGVAALPAGLLTGWVWDRAGAPAALGLGAALAAVAAGALLIWSRAVGGRRADT